MEMCEIKDKLVDIVISVLQKDLDTINTHELGEVVDMIKDVASAMEKCKKAEYYETVTETMKSAPQSTVDDFRRRMYFSEAEPESEMKTIDDVINTIMHMANTMDVNEIMSMKQKLVATVNKL